MISDEEYKMLKGKRYRHHPVLINLSKVSTKHSVVKACISSLPVIARHRDGALLAIPHLDIYTQDFPPGLACNVESLLQPLSLDLDLNRGPTGAMS
jgi:hypothetical protein